MLSSSFESSIPGLYFIGIAANTFGPVMSGAGFAAPLDADDEKVSNAESGISSGRADRRNDKV